MKAPVEPRSYEAALEAERLRLKKHRQTRQGAFEASFVSFEATKEMYYPLAAVIGSRATDDPKALEKLHAAYSKAYKRVKRNAPECLEVFKLIIKNGKDRQKSIWEMVNKIKKQHGALKKTRSMKPRENSMADTESQSAISSKLQIKKTI